MDQVKRNIGYSALKIKYTEKQARLFPSLLGFQGEFASEQDLGSLLSVEESTGNEDPLLMLNPMEEKIN